MYALTLLYAQSVPIQITFCLTHLRPNVYVEQDTFSILLLQDAICVPISSPIAINVQIQTVQNVEKTSHLAISLKIMSALFALQHAINAMALPACNVFLQ